MRTLVIDTALNRLTVGIHDDDTAISVHSQELTKGHQELLAGQVQRALSQAGGLATIDRIGVTVGPGSFTGLRVGMALAQGLATTTRKPLIGLSTLDALALSVDAGVGSVAALIDARRGQVYGRFFPSGRSASPAEALDLAIARERIVDLGAEAVLVGSGASLFADLPNPTLVVSGPEPLALARLCQRAALVDGPLKPLYLRAPDATPPSRRPGQPRQKDHRGAAG